MTDKFNLVEAVLEHIEDTEYSELVMIKRNSNEKRLHKRMLRRAHRGTNWKNVVPKAGFKRVKVGKRYVRVRMKATERIMKKRLGKILGKKKF